MSTAPGCSFPLVAVPFLTCQPHLPPLPDPMTQVPASWACHGQSLGEDRVTWGKLWELSEPPPHHVYLEDSKGVFLAGRAAVRMRRANWCPSTAITISHRLVTSSYRNVFSH